jgi:hypothetical protein
MLVYWCYSTLFMFYLFCVVFMLWDNVGLVVIVLYLSLILGEGRKSKGDFWGIQIKSLVNCTWF